MKRLLYLAAIVFMFAAAAWGQMPPGSISGTVMGEVDGTMVPIPFAHVMAFAPNGFHPIANAMADSTGSYFIRLQLGDYQVKAEAMRFVPEWFDNVPERSQATILHVTADNNPAGINFVLGANQPPPPPPTHPGSIAGMVTDTLSAPIRGARVMADGRDWRHHFSIMTDSTGAYLLPNLPPDIYHVTAVREGFRLGEYPQGVHVDSLPVTGINIQLRPYGPPPPPPPPPVRGSIAGSVVDGVTGAPLEGAHVVAEGRNFFRFAETINDGSYVIRDLPSGSYHVRANKMGYFPGEYPEPVLVDSVAVQGINFSLAPFVETGIEGIVVDGATGLPIAEASVFAINVANPRMHLSVRTNRDGVYHLRAAPGEYVMQAVAMGYWMLELPDHVIVTDGIVENINFSLTGINFGSIAGVVTDTTGAPVIGAIVEARKMTGRFNQHARTDSTGAYIINHITPGAYRVVAFHRGYAPGSYPDSVVVAEGQNVTGINIVLGVILPPFNGTISGIVTDDSTGTPLSHAMVMAIGGRPEGGRMLWQFRYTFSDSTGNYEFAHLPANPFRIFAASRGYMGEFYDNVIRFSEATPVTPNADGINFALAPRPAGPRSIAGQIAVPFGLNPGGNIVYAMADGEITAITVADPFGFYSFDDLETGTYEISSFSVYGEGEIGYPVAVVTDDATDADIVLNPTSVDENEILPQSTSLSQNYPNPFNAQTQISFEIASTGNVELSVFNLIGQKVATLASGQYEAGSYTVIWNGLDTNGNPVSSGLYYYRLQTGSDSETMKMTLLK